MEWCRKLSENKVYVRCRERLSSLGQFLLHFMIRMIGIGEPLNFYSTPLTLTHLPIYLLINEYLRARHRLSTSDETVRKT